MVLSRGVDVSHHQGGIDWPRLKKELGLSWAACKATEGSSFRDSQFAANWAGMKTAGLVRMAYHFARPASDAARQVDFFLSVVKPVAGDVLCLDLEVSDGLDQSQLNAWARQFAAALRKKAPGITLVAYVGGYSRNGSGRNLANCFDYWWYPRYATMNPVTKWPGSFTPRLSGNTTGWRVPHIWQWACSLSTSEGHVDANISTLSAAQLRDGPKGFEDMPLTAAEIDAVAKATVDKLLTASLTNSHNNVSASFAAWLVYGNEKAGDARDGAANTLAAVNLLRDTIRQDIVADLKAALADGTIKVDISVNGVKA